MKIENKKKIQNQIVFKSDETVEEIMLAATLYLKYFLKRKIKINFGIPERIYIQLGEKKFKEIFSDQIYEIAESKNNLLDVYVIKIDEESSKKAIEVFEVSVL